MNASNETYRQASAGLTRAHVQPLVPVEAVTAVNNYLRLSHGLDEYALPQSLVQLIAKLALMAGEER